MVIQIDIQYGRDNDVLDPELQAIIKAVFASNCVWAVHMGTPCCSFPRARETPNGGPPPLLSDEEPYGLTSLKNQSYIEKVALGNLLARFSLYAFEQCRRRFTPVTIENPFMSRLWELPGLSAGA